MDINHLLNGMILQVRFTGVRHSVDGSEIR